MTKQQEKLLSKIKELGPITSQDKDFQKWVMKNIYSGDHYSVTKTKSEKVGWFLSSMKNAGFLGVRKSKTIKNLRKQFVNEYFAI